MKNFTLLVIFGFFALSCTPKNKNKEEWISLFNGKNLEGWKIKISGFPLGENYKQTFRVENGILVVSYDEYEQFQNEFGHLISSESYSHYKLRAEYRFVGAQVKGGPSWAYRNNGLMLHSQSAESMDLHQNFPTSIEAQLYGGIGDDKRTNMNICTPGTIVDINGVEMTDHCFSSGSELVNGEQWTTVEVEVFGDSLIRHLINGENVLEYTNIRLDPKAPENLKFFLNDSIPKWDRGHIAIQAESHRTEFRKIELLDLSLQYN